MHDIAERYIIIIYMELYIKRLRTISISKRKSTFVRSIADIALLGIRQ